MSPHGDSEPGFARNICLPFLLDSRNADGAWGYRPATPSATEPTAWALLALARLDPDGSAVRPARQWLANAQRPDGSWPTRPDTAQGNWVTALAGLALIASPDSSSRLASAARWVCRSHSGESHWRLRLARFLRGRSVVEQDFALRGWSWTPGTASWVEPTAVALLFLHHLPATLAPREAAGRRAMAEAMLYDRMCPGGGWNLGNPKVYGVSGIPQIGPTAWALLALQEHAQREENRLSANWLAGHFGEMASPTSSALAHLALAACGRAGDPLEPRLTAQFQNQAFLANVTAFALAALALAPGPDLLRWHSKP